MDEYFRNSLVRESPEMDRIRDAVREAGISVVLGYSERYNGSIYIAQVRGIAIPNLRMKFWSNVWHWRDSYLLGETVIYRSHRNHCPPPPQNQAHPRRARILRRWAERKSDHHGPNPIRQGVRAQLLGALAALAPILHLLAGYRHPRVELAADLGRTGRWQPMAVAHHPRGKQPLLTGHGHGRRMLRHDGDADPDGKKQEEMSPGGLQICSYPRRRFQYDLRPGWKGTGQAPRPWRGGHLVR